MCKLKRIILERGQIVRHKGERKVIKTAFNDKFGRFTVQFLDNTLCTDMKDLEVDGRK
jgi:hypothetical protein